MKQQLKVFYFEKNKQDGGGEFSDFWGCLGLYLWPEVFGVRSEVSDSVAWGAAGSKEKQGEDHF